MRPVLGLEPLVVGLMPRAKGEHGGSLKGRVIGNAACRGKMIPFPRRPVTGVCAWCGRETCDVQIQGFRCAGCDSDEIDWVAPPAPAAPDKHRHVRDTHVPGTIALSVLGGKVHGQ